MQDKKTITAIMSILIITIIGLGLFVCYNLNKIGTSYYKSIPILCAFIGLFLAYLKISQFDWYKELTDKDYLKYKQLFGLYQYKVLKTRQRYDIFVNDYCNSNVFFASNNSEYTSADSLNQSNLLLGRIKGLLESRKDLVDKYFMKDSFCYSDYVKLNKEYDTTSNTMGINLVKSSIEQFDSKTIEEKLEKVKLEIIKYESGDKTPKHYGHRMFGYLLKENYFTAINDEQRLTEWRKFTNLTTKPEMDYLRNPDSNKNQTYKINEQLKEIAEVFHLIGLKVTITYHEKPPKKK